MPAFETRFLRVRGSSILWIFMQIYNRRSVPSQGAIQTTSSSEEVQSLSQEHGMFRRLCSPGRAHSSRWQRQGCLHPPEPWHRAAPQQSSCSVWLVLSILAQTPWFRIHHLSLPSRSATVSGHWAFPGHLLLVCDTHMPDPVVTEA